MILAHGHRHLRADSQIFHNSSNEEFEESMKTIVAQLEAAVANRVEIPRTRY